MRHVILLLLLATTFACFGQTSNGHSSEASMALQAEPDSLKEQASATSTGQITSFLTFQNNDAEEAMNFYISLFDNSMVIDIQRYGKDGPAKEGTIMMARFELNGSQFACSDSYIKHAWDFTPGVSNWVDCKSEEEIKDLLSKLSEGGTVLMPLGNYGFSSQFAFVEDRFGVSWQLNLE